jgi:hypothetical protein
MLECMEDVLHAGEDEVVGRCSWHRCFCREQSLRVANAQRPGVPQPYGVAADVNCG